MISGCQSSRRAEEFAPGEARSLRTSGFKYRSPEPAVDEGKYSAKAAPVGSGAVAHSKASGCLYGDAFDRARKT